MPRHSPQVRTVQVKAARTVELTFTDGIVRQLDLAPLLRGPVFAEIAASDDAFAEVAVDPLFGTICWPNGADLDPTVLYGLAMPANGRAPVDLAARPGSAPDNLGPTSGR